MNKITKNIICFHKNFTNNIMMADKLKDITKNSNVFLHDNNKHDNNKHDHYNKFLNGKINFHLVNGHINDNTFSINNKIVKPNDDFRSWIYGVTKKNINYELIEYNASINDFNEVNQDIISNINKFNDINKIKFNCAIGISHGVFPTAIMLKNKLVKNAVIICPQTINNDDVFNDIKNSNILFIINSKDSTIKNSLKTYEELSENNNCEVFITTDKNIFSSLNGDTCNKTTYKAINKINKFIKNI